MKVGFGRSAALSIILLGCAIGPAGAWSVGVGGISVGVGSGGVGVSGPGGVSASVGTGGSGGSGGSSGVSVGAGVGGTGASASVGSGGVGAGVSAGDTGVTANVGVTNGQPDVSLGGTGAASGLLGLLGLNGNTPGPTDGVTGGDGSVDPAVIAQSFNTMTVSKRYLVLNRCKKILKNPSAYAAGAVSICQFIAANVSRPSKPAG